MVSLAVAQHVFYLLSVEARAAFVGHVPLVCDTYVTLSAILPALFAEIVQQLAGAAYMVVIGIVEHCLYALYVLRASFFINRLRYDNAVSVLPFPCVSDIRNPAAGYEIYDVAFGEFLENHIYLGLGKASLVGHKSFIYIYIVGEQPTIQAQQGRDDSFRFPCGVFQEVEVVPFQKKKDACAIVWVCLIMYITRSFQDLQGRIDEHGEILVCHAKFIDAELKGASTSCPSAYLEEIGQVFVYISDIFFFGVGLGDSFGQFAGVATIVEQHGIRFLPSLPARPASWK